MHEEYEGSHEVNFDNIMNFPNCDQSDIGARFVYPTPSGFSVPFMLISPDLYFTPMTVYNAAGVIVEPMDIPATLQGAIARIDFHVSMSVYAGMNAKITTITVL